MFLFLLRIIRMLQTETDILVLPIAWICAQVKHHITYRVRADGKWSRDFPLCICVRAPKGKVRLC